MRRLTVFMFAALVVGCSASTQPTDHKTKPSSNPTSEVHPVSTTQAPNQDAAQFQGKPTSFWAKQLSDKDVATRIAAAKALAAIGPAAKSAVADLKNAMKERAWEVLITQSGYNSNRTFTTVSGTIGSAPAKEPSKDEIIAKLRRELAQKDQDLAELRAQQEKFAQDPCLQAFGKAMFVIDRSALEAMLGLEIVSTTKTFKSVGTTIGR